jgi:hypothetical protein
MRKHDARKLDHATLEAMRERAVRRVQEGESPEVVARVFGIGRTAIYRWLAEYRRGGWGALKAKPLFGRPPKLDGKKLQWVYNTVTQKSPLKEHGPELSILLVRDHGALLRAACWCWQGQNGRLDRGCSQACSPAQCDLTGQETLAFFIETGGWPMPKHRSDGERKSVPCGGVKAASRASGSGKALALTRLKDTDIVMAEVSRPQAARAGAGKRSP